MSLPDTAAEALARRLLAAAPVAPVGLGARDSLRLEAGLCLYGHELNEQIDPVEAGLMWSIGKARRVDGERAGGFPGAARIFQHMTDRPARRRVGLTVAGKRPVREGQSVLAQDGRVVGAVTSAGYGASVGGPIAMAYIERGLAEPGNCLTVDVRGRPVPVSVTRMPFTPQRYYRG